LFYLSADSQQQLSIACFASGQYSLPSFCSQQQVTIFSPVSVHRKLDCVSPAHAATTAKKSKANPETSLRIVSLLTNGSMTREA